MANISTIGYISMTRKTCWIINEGIAGTQNQCIGLAKALDLNYTLKHVTLRFPWSLTVPWFMPLKKYATKSIGNTTINAPYPDVIIASGRKAVPITIALKEKLGRAVKTIFIQDPRCNPKYFDHVVLPSHDPTRGDNVIVTSGALNQISPYICTAEAEKFRYLLKNKPERVVTVLIGGNSKAHTMDAPLTNDICDALRKIAEDNAVLVTASRRTGEENQIILKERLNPLENCYFWDGSGDNPYFGFLGLADIIVVTNDSASMISESLTVGKPTYIYPLKGGARRIDRFNDDIVKQDLARPFTQDLQSWDKPILNETNRVASLLKEML